MWTTLYSFFTTVLTALIIARCYKSVFLILQIVYIWYIRPKHDLSVYFDMWTVVTGATDGIGKAYTKELAKRGVRKFFLIGRNAAKLGDVADMMELEFKCHVETAVFDFASDDFDKLPHQLREYEIGILVNCAGIAPSKIGNLTGQIEGTASKIIRVNLMSAIKMTELIVPGMVLRNRGIVINIASITGWRPLPYLSSYPASKAGLSFFTSGLNDEYCGSKLQFQCLMPILVATNMTQYSKAQADGYLVVTPEVFVKDAIDVIGFSMCTGCKFHDMQIALAVLVPFWMLKMIFVPFVLLGMHKKRFEDSKSFEEQKVR